MILSQMNLVTNIPYIDVWPIHNRNTVFHFTKSFYWILNFMDSLFNSNFIDTFYNFRNIIWSVHCESTIFINFNCINTTTIIDNQSNNLFEVIITYKL